jgi:hypothetical protein
MPLPRQTLNALKWTLKTTLTRKLKRINIGLPQLMYIELEQIYKKKRDLLIDQL